MFFMRKLTLNCFKTGKQLMKTAGDANCFIQEKPTTKVNKNKVSEHKKKR